jgi:hypothetical protein
LCSEWIIKRNFHFLLATKQILMKWIYDYDISYFNLTSDLSSYILRRPHNFSKSSPYFWLALQGVSTRYDILLSPRWPTKNDFQVQKKEAAHSGDGDIWVLSIFFEKSNIGCPQQPPTEMVPIFNLIFYDFTNIFFLFKTSN